MRTTLFQLPFTLMTISSDLNCYDRHYLAATAVVVLATMEFLGASTSGKISSPAPPPMGSVNTSSRVWEFSLHHHLRATTWNLLASDVSAASLMSIIIISKLISETSESAEWLTQSGNASIATLWHSYIIVISTPHNLKYISVNVAVLVIS